ILGIDVLQPDEDASYSGARCLLDEIRDAVAQRIDLDREADIQACLAQGDHPIKQRLPVPVAGEIVVGDEEALDALRAIFPDDPLQIVRRAEPALAALHVDNCAERTLIRAPAAEIDTGERTRGAAHMLAR